MLSPGLWLLVTLGWAAVPAAVWAMVTWRRRVEERRDDGPQLLCEAVGGPCDGRMWFLPEPAPVWLRDGGSHHLYRPAAAGAVGVDYAYAGVTTTGPATTLAAR